MSLTNSIELFGVNKHFGDHHAVDDISLTVPTGSVYGFLGPNGAGKTSTIRMIMGILYPDSGSLKVLGETVPERVKHRLGYLPEEKGLYKKMRVLELITYFGRLKGLNHSEAEHAAGNMLDRFDLGHTRMLRCESLSKGMGQKVQIITTLIHKPDIVILDEPFSGLDPVNVEMVRELILDLKDSGRTVIFSTHIMEQAEKICDHLLLINHGKKMLDGPIGQVKQRFDNTIVVEYQGDPIHFQHPGIERINNMGRTAELSIRPGADTQAIIMDLMKALQITHFSVKEPSLHEIFIRTVGEQQP